MTSLVKAAPRFQKTLRVKPALAALGLSPGTRWNAAAARIKFYMVTARRNEDMEAASILSEIKSFLKRNLLNECSCGVAIAPGNINCRMCASSKQVGT
jgi:hypothetical protein